MVAFGVVVDTIMGISFNRTKSVFSYSNKRPLQLLAATPAGRATIGLWLDTFYSIGWYEAAAPYLQPIFYQERQKYIGGLTSLEAGCLRP
jgi:hypothetical protein